MTSMDALTPEQCRAARAVLDMQQRELAAKSKVSKKTIADFERGLRSPYVRTLEDLRRTFEAEGVVFVPPVEGVHSGAVGLKWGFKPVARTASRSEDQDGVGSSGLDAMGWDDWEGDSVEDDEPLPPLDWTDDDKRSQIEMWRSQPEKWAALHEVSRQALLRAMGVDRLGAE
jgi:transcriptional regulator with XRE-family HTH domain